MSTKPLKKRENKALDKLLKTAQADKMVCEELQSQIKKPLPTSKGFPVNKSQQFFQILTSDDQAGNFIPKRGKRGRKRNKDSDYFEKCFVELEEK